MKLAVNTEKEGEKKLTDSTSIKTERLVAQKNTKSVFVFHKVRKGETIYMISKKYGLSSEDIIEVNNLQSKNLKIGQVLKIKNN